MKKEVLTVSILALVAFLTRVTNLLAVPIFTDEAIYIRWAQIGLNDPAHRYISQTDGKQPLLTWLMYPMLLIFQDPLFAGRFVSVISGVLACIGMYFLGKTLFNRKVGITASFLYIFSPFALVYDKLALMDSLLAMLGIWSIYLSVRLAKTPRLDIALLLGMTAGFGMLTKSSAQFFLYSLPFSLLLFHWKEKRRFLHLFRWGSAVLLAAIIALGMYSSLRLSPWFYIIEQKNHTFIYTFGEFFASPLEHFYPNLTGMVPWLAEYVTIPIALCMLGGIAYGMYKRNWKILYLTLWFLFPFCVMAAFGRVIFPRFMLFMVMPLYVVAAYIISLFLERVGPFAVKGPTLFRFIRWVVLAIVFLYPIYQSIILISSPVHANISQTDRNQLFDDWPSGWGVREVIDYLEKEAEKGKIVIGTEGTFGLNPAVYEIYLGTNPNVEIHSYWPVGEVPIELLEKARAHPTYLIFKERGQEVPSNWPLQLISKYKRGLGETYLLFYQVIPSNTSS